MHWSSRLTRAHRMQAKAIENFDYSRKIHRVVADALGSGIPKRRNHARGRNASDVAITVRRGPRYARAARSSGRACAGAAAAEPTGRHEAVAVKARAQPLCRPKDATTRRVMRALIWQNAQFA
eukprot:2697524-Pleurochrysis_carterae.AAC.1